VLLKGPVAKACWCALGVNLGSALVPTHVLDKFKKYLVGAKFIVKTDHNNLKYFLEKKDLNERKHKWVSKIQAYYFDIEFFKGKNNVVADALSRRPSSYTMSEILVEWKSYLLVEL
jgi:hypothetical protein